MKVSNIYLLPVVGALCLGTPSALAETAPEEAVEGVGEEEGVEEGVGFGDKVS